MINMIEIFGYISMVVVLISTMMKDMKRLRIINSIGCLMFVIYGLYMQTYPIVAMNIVVILIHLWRLYKGES
jgi:Flp pilus assembly protein protease CpaA